MEKKINVYFIPTFSDENDYLKNITKGLTNNNVTVLSDGCIDRRKAPFESIYYAIKYKNYLVHFNWIENKVNNKTVKAYLNFIIIKIWISLLKLFGAKIVWTMHNKKPHASEKSNLIEYFYSYFVKKCDLIVVHCSESISILKNDMNYHGKTIFIPHGSYCSSMEKITNDNMEKLRFLYFGAVSRYKNIPILVKAYEQVIKNFPNVKLSICGKCRDEKLDLEIKNACDKNVGINYNNKFLTDDELSKELEKCCAVILPYDKQSMLNSGSAIMAFSKGRSIIISEFGYIKDIKNRKFVNSYDYDAEESHEYSLEKTWENAIEKSYVQNNYWEDMGHEAYLFAREELDWNRICCRLAQAYQEI